MALKALVLAVIALTGLFAAGNAVPARSSSESIVQNLPSIAYGDTVSFTPSPDASGTFTYSDPAAQRIVIDCYQGKKWVFESNDSPVYAITLSQAGDYRTPYAIAHGHGVLWTGGAADCTIKSGYMASPSRFITTASLDFAVGA